MLLSILMPLKDETFGIPAALSARINLSNLVQRIADHSFNQTGEISVIDQHGKKLFDPSSPDLNNDSVIAHAVKILRSSTRTIGVEPYVRPSGQKNACCLRLPHFYRLGSDC